jgi:hypothetical protein
MNKSIIINITFFSLFVLNINTFTMAENSNTLSQKHFIEKEKFPDEIAIIEKEKESLENTIRNYENAIIAVALFFIVVILFILTQYYKKAKEVKTLKSKL